MSEELKKLTISELKTYLYSLEDEKKQEKDKQVKAYKTQCTKDNKKESNKEIQKIKKKINKEYAPMMVAKEKILNLLEECSNIPKNIEKLEVTKYMIYRAEVDSGEKQVSKVIKRLEKKYNKIVETIVDTVDVFPICENIDELDFNEYKAEGKAVTRAMNKYKEEYTQEEKMALIQKELDIMDKIKVFNTVPIPHEILKSSDRDIQLKMKKFNNIRQKRLKILATMEADYLKLLEPREVETMIDDAIVNVETVSTILARSEYKNIRNNLLRKKRKIYKQTSEVRSIIKTKESKTGIINFEVQEARHNRMEKLRTVITQALQEIKANEFSHFEEQLKKLKLSFEKEKQFANIIEKLDDVNSNNANSQVKVYEDRIRNLEQKINTSKEIIKEKQEEIEKAKKELLVLWKMEISSTISNKKETLLLPEQAEENKENKNTKTKIMLSKIKKVQNGKHACV